MLLCKTSIPGMTFQGLWLKEARHSKKIGLRLKVLPGTSDAYRTTRVFAFCVMCRLRAVACAVRSFRVPCNILRVLFVLAFYDN